METNPFFPAKVAQSRWMALLLWTMMAVGFGGTGWAYGVRPISVMIHEWRLAQDYREVEAKIVGSSVPLPGGGTHSIVAAQYEIDGKQYHTTRLTLVDESALDEPENMGFANSLGSMANTDAKTTVWVDPKNPARAVVSRFITEQAIIRRIPLALAFTILAMVGIAGAVGALGNFSYYRWFDRQKKFWIFMAAGCAVVFPLRRLFVDPAVDFDDDLRSFVFVLEFVALLFILGAIKLLPESDAAGARNSRNESASAATKPARSKRKKQ